MNWTEIVSAAREMDMRFRADGSLAWYRGERDSAWRLRSTVHRHVQEITRDVVPPVSDDDLRELLAEEAKTIYRRFKADAWPLLKSRERSPWGVLFAMQHFGIPTRLLDWTESFACAVLFAQLKRKRGDSAAIWVLDPQALNRSTTQQDGLLALDDDTVDHRIDARAWHPSRKLPTEPLPSVAVAPIFTNPRMVSQRSAFVLSGDTFAPLDEQGGGELVRQGRLAKLVLGPETHDEVDAFLAMAGVTAFTFYPDLEGLALKHKAETARKIRDAKALYPDHFS